MLQAVVNEQAVYSSPNMSAEVLSQLAERREERGPAEGMEASLLAKEEALENMQATLKVCRVEL